MQLPNPKCIASYQHAHSVCPETNMHHPLVLSWHAAEQALSPPPPLKQAPHTFQDVPVWTALLTALH